MRNPKEELGFRDHMGEKLGEREIGWAPEERVRVQQNHQKAHIVCNHTIKRLEVEDGTSLCEFLETEREWEERETGVELRRGRSHSWVVMWALLNCSMSTGQWSEMLCYWLIPRAGACGGTTPLVKFGWILNQNSASYLCLRNVS